ncbi:uncharacterized protein LOC131433751 [Malaya genurostris]|uniref:uncharacterized protein LOC131433751 n=1 Tax=Malaya genurostris TaxID=325434 RepID=UPI0026F3DD07|nr:uncharacterized protein LOC131433751 [Malaya genurostris]
MEHNSYNIATININTITNPTKTNALQTFVRMMDLDIIFLQEVENNQFNLQGYNVICNVDQSRRGTAIALKEHIQFSHVEKSLDGRLVTLRISNTTLCNVYAPSGSAVRAERERFFNNSLAYYLRQSTEHVILAGDFNCVLRPCDATGYNTSSSLRATIQQLQLHDVWIKLNPQMPGHTYITHNSTSRLDRIYVSSGLCDKLRNANIHVCSFTNHKALTTRVCLPHLGREPGRGFWSLRPHLLTPDNIEEFRYNWQYWTRQRRNFSSWMNWWMAYAKPKIKSFFRWKSKLVFEDFHRENQRLYAQLRLAYDSYYQNQSMLTTINRIKAEMLNHQRQFTHMFVRINETHIAGELMSTFQLGERRRKRTMITQLRSEEDEIIDRPEHIEQHLLEYYTTLYTANETTEERYEYFACERAIPENDESNEACTSEITTAEIKEAIKTSASKKSPGTDGIPKEFYLHTFDVIHRELNLVINEALN